MVMDGGMNGGEFLQTSHTTKAQHRPFSSPKWLVRILASVVQPAPGFLLVRIACIGVLTACLCFASSSHAQNITISTSVWAGARIPIENWRLLDRPVRSVWEASVTDYSGDQEEVLDISWLARVGTGLELDISGTSK